MSTATVPATERGEIKFFKEKNGYGFISREGHPDLFCHIKDFAGYDPRFKGGFYPSKGDRVEFTVDERAGKKIAKNIRIVEESLGE